MYSQTTMSSYNNQEYSPKIVIPQRISKNRKPGEYPDTPSLFKTKNNILIIHACKFLKAFDNEEGIRALVLDGKEMRTTNTLRNLGNKIKSIDIVEINNETFINMKKQCLNDKKIHFFNCHINDYITNYNNPKTNVAYFDIMSTFLSSEKSFGSDFVINEFLKQSKVDEIILAATFCLRCPSKMSFEIHKRQIKILLNKIFEFNGFIGKILVPEEELKYKGQNGPNNSMMFVAYYLERNNFNEIDN